MPENFVKTENFCLPTIEMSIEISVVLRSPEYYSQFPSESF